MDICNEEPFLKEREVESVELTVVWKVSDNGLSSLSPLTEELESPNGLFAL